MKKNLLLSLLAAVIIPPVYAIPVHNISLNFGAAFPGETELAAYYNLSIGDSIKVYDIGLSYDFAPLEFMTIGAGCKVMLRPFTSTYGVFMDTVNLTAVEPFGQIRFYLPLMEGFDVFAGGGAGYAVLVGSTFANGQTSVTSDINGSAVTYKFGGGIAYNQGIFTAILDIGYRSCSITPSPAVTNPNPPGNGLVVNLGGFYATMGAAVSFGSHKQAKTDGEIKKQLDREVSGLEDAPATGTEEVKTDGVYAAAPETEKKDQTEQVSAASTDDSMIDSAPVAATPVPTAAENKEVQKTENFAAAENASPDEGGDTDGIIILSPGESETSELEKYITNKRKQFKPLDEEPEEQGADGEDLVFNYGSEEAGIIVVEAESKGTVDRAGYVLVEKGGFISGNFSGDGYIYSLDEHKEMLVAGDFAYIKLTAGIGAPKGKQFTIFDDSEEVMNPATGEMLGKMIKFLGVAKVANSIEDNIFKVQITKSYDPIRNNYKIKARQDLKKYHKEINLKVRKKNVEARASIVKVKDDVQNLKNRDLVYLDAGIIAGLLPGEKMGIFRQSTETASGKQSDYHRIGTLFIINSMQTSSVGLIVKNDDVIKVGDIVKTLGK